MAPRYDLRALLLGLVFLHGAFAAGMIPLLNRQLGERAPLAFTLYFGGMVAAQLALYRFAPLSRPRKALGIYELLFAGALAYMALTMTVWGFLSGRWLEGLGSGFTLPLIFAGVVRLEAWGSPEKRIALMNTSFALGFVAGPFVAEGGLSALGTSRLLLAFAAAFALLGLGVLVRPTSPDPARGARSTASAPPALARFWPLFVAKLAYGFILALLSGFAQTLFPGASLSWILLGLACVFVPGQALAIQGLKRFGSAAVLRAAPLVLVGGALALALTGRGAWIYLMSVGHSALVLMGYRLLAADPENARSFALYNALTDPAMLLGALLASRGVPGAWGLVALGVVALFLPTPPPGGGAVSDRAEDVAKLAAQEGSPGPTSSPPADPNDTEPA